jgi:hypothetical protein
MEKPAGGGGSASFPLNVSNSGSVGSEVWINLGAIPSGLRIWFGNGTYSSINKTIVFDLRTNNIGSAVGNITNTALLGSVSVTARTQTVAVDYYKKGTLHTISVISTGIERFWLRVYSKSGSLGSYLYSINYTTE